MVLACELSFNDAAHVPFNAGLLATMHTAFPKESIVFLASAAHIEELRKEVGPSLANWIAWEEIHSPTPGTNYISRFLVEFRIILNLLTMLPQDASSYLVLTSAYPSTVLALKVALWFRAMRTPVQIVLHGMSGVIGRRYKNPVRRFRDMRTALTVLGNTNIQYLVLEKSIRDTVLESLPSLCGNIEVFEHPISPNEGSCQTVDFKDPIRFGFLGLADKPKGFPLFVKLANHITPKYGARVEFHAIGRFPQNDGAMNGTEILAIKPGITRMGRVDFMRGVSPLHFVVLPHEALSYTLAASGVLLDAIAWGKPVIARRIPIFEAMFERHGDIGYLFNDEDELKDGVERILIRRDKSRYHNQVINVLAARQSRVPEALAASYRQLRSKIA
jgi:glycosyltransferase involved in cell wall biosynthesis